MLIAESLVPASTIPFSYVAIRMDWVFTRVPAPRNRDWMTETLTAASDTPESSLTSGTPAVINVPVGRGFSTALHMSGWRMDRRRE